MRNFYAKNYTYSKSLKKNFKAIKQKKDNAGVFSRK